MKEICITNEEALSSAQILFSSISTYLFNSDCLDVFLRGIHLNNSYFTSRNSIQLKAIDDLVSTGATLRIKHVERFFPILRLACQKLECEFKEAVWLNAYVSTFNSTGLGEHTDDHSVIAFQLLGKKNWSLQSSTPSILANKVLHGISWLHIPKNTPHATKTISPLSIHLSLGCVKTLETSEIKICVKKIKNAIEHFSKTKFCPVHVEVNFPKSIKLAASV